jgi:hypothetical protein
MVDLGEHLDFLRGLSYNASGSLRGFWRRTAAKEVRQLFAAF